MDPASRVWSHAVEEIAKEDTMTQTIATQHGSEQAADKTAIRPFRVNVPEAELTELRRRINATRFPERETVTDFSQGVPLATVQKLARYWATEYDWRKVEARLNAVPNFITEIDGLDIHFIHVRSKHEKALPVIVTHGWPGSIIEQLKLIEPLTNPTAHGGSAADAFHVVIPSMPGYGFSGKPTTTGWGPERIARAWDVLMKRLGYTSYVAQGGDWGAVIVTRPQTLTALSDSPVGLATFLLDHDARSLELIARSFDGVKEGLTRDDVLDNVTSFWLTNTGVSASRLYTVATGRGWENKLGFFTPKGVKIPVAASAFPDDLYQAPRSWVERAYPKLIHYNKLDKGGHFAAWEQPQLLSEEIRVGFRSLRN
jgi:pimeloyl-ACP methyl ester carboxylesterase